MAVTLRGQTVAFDNIAVGKATGTERTIKGSPPPAEKVGGLDNPKAGSAFPTGNRADNHVAGTATPSGENRK